MPRADLILFTFHASDRLRSDRLRSGHLRVSDKTGFRQGR